MYYVAVALIIAIIFVTLILKYQKIALTLIPSSIGFILIYLVFIYNNPPKNSVITLTSYGNLKIILNYYDENFLFLSIALVSLTPLVLFYLTEYYNKKNYSKSVITIYIFIFFCALCLLGIALAANLFTMFIFYELLTLCTIPLLSSGISKEIKSTLQCYLSLLIGSSLFFILPMVFIVGNADFSYDGIIENHFSQTQALLILCSFIFGFSKAAIFPLHSWIIKAMIAPYPISGIIHGVIVVKAGIICLLKVFYCIFGINYFEYLIYQNSWLMAIPMISILYSSIKANTENEIKKILAFSTISQLSLIILIAMNSKFAIVQIAILNHAINKLMLFLAFGTLYSLYDITKIHDLRGIYNKEPITLIYIILAVFSIAGIPFSAGGLVKKTIANDLYFEVSAMFILCQILTTSYLYRLVRQFFNSSKPTYSIANKKISVDPFLI
jgi:multicomponent Na+:H+ antiporter subunit D